MTRLRRVAVFCGSSAGSRTAYAEAAAGLGRLLGGRGIGLVYGGSNVGLMKVVADRALEAGAAVIGVIPDQLVSRELAHPGLTELRVVGSMHERKAVMADLADAFVALPGGIGTLDELFETWAWGHLGLHEKPLGLLDVAGYFAPLIGFLDGMVAEGFLRRESREMLLVETDPARLLERLARCAAGAGGQRAIREAR